MAPPQQKLSSNLVVPGDEERILQAIVLGDSFNERFMPITLDKPRCLLPLLNVPLIEYTLEFLAMSGIQEAVLFCRSHADQLRAYIAQSRWCRPTSTLTVQVVVSSECSSVGDALRDIDSRQLIRGDFVLCYGDTVANVNLGLLLAKFREQRQKDKSLIMTIVTRQALPGHRTREHGEMAIFGVLPNNDFEVKYYASLDHTPIRAIDTDDYHSNRTIKDEIEAKQKKSLQLPLDLLTEHGELELRYDLLDCNIDVCSLEVLASFTENFDYQDLRRDFVRGILGNWELLGQRVGVHILQDEYAARIRNSALYDAISRDVLARWVFPIVPDSSILGVESHERLHFKGENSYLGDQVLLARTAQVQAGSLVGTGSTVGPNAKILESVIGRGVQIGADCFIRGSYLWDGVIVEAGCQLTGCIVSDRARIKSGSVIHPGCLVTSEVVIGPKASLPRNCRIAKFSDRMDQAMQALGLGSLEALTSAATSSAAQLHKVLGKDSDGVIWELEHDNPIFTISLCHDLITLGDLSEPEERKDSPPNRSSSKMNEASSRSMHPSQMHNFEQEALETLLNAFGNDYEVEDAALELNALKLACNASFIECREAIIKSLFAWAKDTEHAMSLTRKWAPLLDHYVKNLTDELHVLNLLDSQSEYAVLASFMVPILYDCDIISEDSFLSWFEANNDDNGSRSLLKKRLIAFRDFLLQSDEVDGEESDDEEPLNSKSIY